MSKCFRCGGVVPEPDLKEAVAREQDFRSNFAQTWGEGRVLTCNECFEEMVAEETPQEFEEKEYE